MGSRWMAKRPLAAAAVAAVALCLALGACSSSSPRTGVVATVNTGASSGPPGDPPVTAEPPVDGLRPLAVARGFMAAMSSMDPTIAETWVADDPAALAAVRGWAESTEVRVYDRFDVAHAPPPADGDAGGDAAQVTVAPRQQGTLAGGTWQPVAGDQRFTLTLRRETGEWRVANPPTSPWITTADFMDVYERAMVYLVAPDGAHLSPQPVFFPTPERPPPNTEGELPPRWEDATAVRIALDRLLAGPAGDHPEITTAIPTGARVLDVAISEAAVKVDLSPEFAGSGGGPGLLRVGQVVWTAMTLMPTHEVELTVGGAPPGVIGPDRFDAGGRWRGDAEPLDNLRPTRGGSAGEVLFTRGGRIHTVPVGGGESGIREIPFTADPAGPMSAPTWSPAADRIAFLVGQDRGETLHVGAADGGEAQATDLTGELSAPSWTPDGDRLLALNHDQGTTTLWSVDAASGTARQLQLPPLPAEGRAPAAIGVSPDGASAVVVGVPDPQRPERGGAMFSGRLTDGGITSWTPLALAPGIDAAHSPVWLEPTVIGFVVNSGGLGDEGTLWTVESDGWNPDEVQLGSERPGELGNQLSASPDGDQLVFTVRSDPGTNQIFTLRRRGEDTLPQPLTGPESYASDTDPSLSSH